MRSWSARGRRGCAWRRALRPRARGRPYRADAGGAPRARRGSLGQAGLARERARRLRCARVSAARPGKRTSCPRPLHCAPPNQRSLVNRFHSTTKCLPPKYHIHLDPAMLKPLPPTIEHSFEITHLLILFALGAPLCGRIYLQT